MLLRDGQPGIGEPRLPCRGAVPDRLLPAALNRGISRTALLQLPCKAVGASLDRMDLEACCLNLSLMVSESAARGNMIANNHDPGWPGGRLGQKHGPPPGSPVADVLADLPAPDS